MRIPRFVMSSEEGEAIYHCMSRTVNGERLFAEDDREMLRRMLWNVAEFCGVEVVTYTIMPNHFHVLVRVPKKGKISDKELLRRYRLLHPRRNKYQTAALEVIEKQLAEDAPEGVAWRERMMKLMCDLSQFMKLFKQRVSIWYNRTHGRFGPLWSERFKSVLVEDGEALLTMAAYIDLNCVKARLATDPKDYRFCGYSEAVAGRTKARRGLSGVFGY
ncbi:MAG: transposase, partial [Opitutaceae bacterium]